MKLYLSVDMEGIAGITSPQQQKEDELQFRQALHRQIEWIVEGICASKANAQIQEITIADSHGSGTNLSYETISRLDPRISLVSGSPRRQFMMSALDSTYDLVFLVGYHAGAGEIKASMDHCYSGKAVHCLQINGKTKNEATTNAAYAGELGVPVGLVIGDSGLYQQLQDTKELPWVEFVQTKQSISRTAARYRSQAQLQKETVEKVQKVLDSDYSALPLSQIQIPCTLSLTFQTTAMAEMVAQVPNTKRIDGRTVSIVCQDMGVLECAISAFTALAGTV